MLKERGWGRLRFRLTKTIQMEMSDGVLSYSTYFIDVVIDLCALFASTTANNKKNKHVRQSWVNEHG